MYDNYKTMLPKFKYILIKLCMYSLCPHFVKYHGEQSIFSSITTVYLIVWKYIFTFGLRNNKITELLPIIILGTKS